MFPCVADVRAAAMSACREANPQDRSWFRSAMPLLEGFCCYVSFDLFHEWHHPDIFFYFHFPVIPDIVPVMTPQQVSPFWLFFYICSWSSVFRALDTKWLSGLDVTPDRSLVAGCDQCTSLAHHWIKAPWEVRRGSGVCKMRPSRAIFLCVLILNLFFCLKTVWTPNILNPLSYQGGS